MRLSFSTNAFVRHSVFDAVEKIAAAGYGAVELLADIPHLYADAVTNSDLVRLQKVLARTGLRVANVNANTAVGYYGREFWEPLFEPSLANPEKSARRWRIDYSKKCIDMASVLGCPGVSITSGRMVAGVGQEKAMRLLRESLDEVLDHAARKSVRVGVEYEPGLLIERFEELVDLILQVRSPLLGANLDLGHSHVLGEDPETVIAALSPNIFHVHIEDIRAKKHYHLIPGLGDMDFGLLFRLLERHSYGGFATVELYTYPDRPERAAREALHHLQRFTSQENQETQ